MGKTIQITGFPPDITAEKVKDFLEHRTGQDTVYAVQVKQHKNQHKKQNKTVYAIIQFTEDKYAASIRTAYENSPFGFVYECTCLKVFPEKDDIIQIPEGSLHSSPHSKVSLGYQICSEKFFQLWSDEDAYVAFGNGMQKFCFSTTFSDVNYKLEIPYKSIRHVNLHSPQDNPSRFLVIQLLGAPKIFEKDEEADDLREFYKNIFDGQWIRTTDFTPSKSIGQSTALYLEFTCPLNNSDFTEEFAHFSEHPQNFIIREGFPYSSDTTTLVPIVVPPASFELPFEILLKVNSMMHTGCLPGPMLNDDFYELLDPIAHDRNLIDYSLDKLSHQEECCYDPKKWLIEEYEQLMDKRNSLKSPIISLEDGLFYIYRLEITPTRVFLRGPEVNVSNFVIRQYSNYINNFLRISFVDEDFENIPPTDLSCRSSTPRRTKLYERIYNVLHDGFFIGDKNFEFLAFSSNQLRDSSVWMFAAASNEVTAASIRAWMGDFSGIRNIAKYGSRLGQSFSSSIETLEVEQNEIEIIPDVTEDTSYVFSDGIGKISAEFAELVARECDLTEIDPCAFQIRFGGYKGVVAIDPESSKKLSLRNSMKKFESNNRKLGVVAWTKYQPCYLNRQLITLLSTLGIKDHVFEGKQDKIVEKLDKILTDPLEAQEALKIMAHGEDTNILKALLFSGYEPNSEPFLSMMLQNFRASKLLEIRTKSRIFIHQGRAAMGCLDETRTLEQGEVFAQFSDPTRPGKREFITGPVVVAKSPCLHPGDVRVLKAVKVQGLSHMVDCVVFPQQGTRPHPNECSGSDLDGDMYFVCWDKDLIPSRTCDPMDYTPEAPQILDHDVTIEDVKGYFLDFLLNDTLGRISNLHTVFADKEERKAESEKCIQLAKLFSTAVDFPKTGIPAEIPPYLNATEYPDFMEKSDKSTYMSKNVIGKLFRKVKALAPSSIKSFAKDVATKSYDKHMEMKGFDRYVDEAFFHKTNYDSKLSSLMAYYGIKTEVEILSFSKRSDATSIASAVRSLRKEAMSWFNAREEGDEAFDEKAKASAWYHVTYHPDYWGRYKKDSKRKRDHFLSFPWCIYDKLVNIRMENIELTLKIPEGSDS